MFEGARVVVTGGSSGIGLVAAQLFASRGAHVGLVARDPEKLQAAREAVRAAASRSDARVEAVSADLSVWEQASSAIGELASRGLEPDILVNSAGTILPGRFEEMPLEYFTRNMDWGYYSVLYPTRAAVPGMIARGRGHVVNVSSVAGFIGVYGYTGYSAAKFAVMGMTESLRCEMKPHGVRVSVVCPPDTDTPALAYEKTLRPPETDVIAGNIKAIPPSKVAEAIVRGVERGKYLIIPDFESRVYGKLKGVVPGLFFAVFDSQVAKARRGRGA